MRRQKSVLLRDALSIVIREANLEDGLIAVQAGRAFDRAVGQVIAAHVVNRTFENGVLTCSVDSSVVRAHLEFDKENLRGIINEILEDDIISSIRFI
ncbi:MAG: DUF721 domain-containing protein [Bacteroidales bacterium]|nr:DUF721 domain-containing protein [Bacteroidales bacterium]